MAPSSSSSSSSKAKKEQQHQLDALEAAAVDKAKAQADTHFVPSASALASTPSLLRAVDGLSNLKEYSATESVYVGRVVPVKAGTVVDIPITVAAPGSMVEYAVEVAAFDVEFSITAERDEGMTVVKEPSRLTVPDCPATQKFLVGTVPCLLKFSFRNDYSWMRDKHVSYNITVTPPTREALAAGRRRRAQACLTAVQADAAAAAQRWDAAVQQANTIDTQVAELQQKLTAFTAAQGQARKEVTWLKERKTLRTEQMKQLQRRLQQGWEDEQ